MKYKLLVFALLLWTGVALAQGGVLSGKVTGPGVGNGGYLKSRCPCDDAVEVETGYGPATYVGRV